MTVVFDSGVLISALAFGGIPLDALRAASLFGTVAICSQIEREVRECLVGKKIKWPQELADLTIAELVANMICLEVPGNVLGFCRDPKDDMILECALIAKAKFIVSGDRDLLDLVDFRGISILTARMFYELVTVNTGPGGVN